MKKFIFLFILSFPVITWGQSLQDKVKVQWSPEEKKTMKSAFFDIQPVGYDNKGFYGLNIPYSEVIEGAILTNDKYTISRLSPDLTQMTSEPLDLKEEGKEKRFEFVLWLNNRIYVFTSFQNQKLRKTFLFAQTIDKNSLKVNNDLLPIAEVDYNKFDKYKYANFGYSFSPDSSMLLVNYSLLDKNDMTLNMGITVLDKKLTKVWEYSGDLTGKNTGIFSFKQYAVSNSGDVYILGQVFENMKAYSNNMLYKKVVPLPFFSDRRLVIQPNYKYNVVCLWEKGKTIKDFDLKQQGIFVRDIVIAPSGKNELICTGLYSRENTMSAMGSCFFKLDKKNQSVILANNTPFETDILTKGMSQKEISKFRKNLTSGKEFEKVVYYLKPVQFRGDNEFWFMAEQVDHQRIARRSGNTITINHIYINQDVYVAKYQTNGKLQWTQKVNKEQYTANEGYVISSFKPVPTGNSLNLIYSEMSKKDYGFFKLKRSGSYICRLDENGKEDKLKFADTEETGVALRPANAGYFSPSSMVILGQEGERKFKFVKLNITK